MQKFVKYGFIVLVISLSLSACGPSQAEQDAQATQIVEDFYATQTAAPTATATSTPAPTATSTATATPTHTSTPTPIPGKFINPPEYLETVFFSDWFWMTNALGNKVGTIFQDDDTVKIMSHGEDRGISLSILFLNPAANESQLLNDFISSILIYYVSNTAQEQIAQYVTVNTEIGKHETTIESFGIIFDISLNKGDRVLQITIYEK